jgi:hypothetical protein
VGRELLSRDGVLRQIQTGLQWLPSAGWAWRRALTPKITSDAAVALRSWEKALQEATLSFESISEPLNDTTQLKPVQEDESSETNSNSTWNLTTQESGILHGCQGQAPEPLSDSVYVEREAARLHTAAATAAVCDQSGVSNSGYATEHTESERNCQGVHAPGSEYDESENDEDDFACWTLGAVAHAKALYYVPRLYECVACISHSSEKYMDHRCRDDKYIDKSGVGAHVFECKH